MYHQIQTRITAQDAAGKIAEGALLIDVRSAEGRAKNGEVVGAVVIAKTDVLKVLSKLVRRSDDTQSIVAFCGSVLGSGPVVDELAAAGFTGVHDVEGGFAALVGQGITVVPPPTPAA